MKLFIFLFTFLFFNLSIFAKGKADSLSINYYTSKFKEILRIISENYCDTIDYKKISEAAYISLLKELDNNSIYFPAEQYKNISKGVKGSSVGVGLQLVSINDTIRIGQIIKNSPASNSILKIGDKVLFINNVNYTKQDVNLANNALLGPIDSDCQIIIKRNNELNEVILKRKEFTSPTINHYIKDSALVLKINSFSNQSHNEIAEILNTFNPNAIKLIIIDLRNNIGGVIETALKIADEFIEDNIKISELKVTNKDYEYNYTTKIKGKFEKTPLICIINENTASASEIIAGAFQDLDRAILIGGNSYGKGTVQRTWEFADSSAFRITFGSYLTPLGREINKAKSNDNIVDLGLKLQLGEEKAKEVQEMMNKYNSKNVKIIKSKKGRDLISFGNIIPDIKIKEDTLTLLTNVAKSKGLFFEFAENLINTKIINNDYLKNLDIFANNFDVTDEILNSFKLMLISKNTWNELMFKTDIRFIKALIKAQIAYFLWDDEGYHYIIGNEDNLIINALKNYKLAFDLLNK